MPHVKALRAQVDQLQRERATEVKALKSENAGIKARLKMPERAATVLESEILAFGVLILVGYRRLKTEDETQDWIFDWCTRHDSNMRPPDS